MRDMRRPTRPSQSTSPPTFRSRASRSDEDALRGREDADAEAARGPRDLRRADVDAQAGRLTRRMPVITGRRAVVVAQRDAQRSLPRRRLDRRRRRRGSPRRPARARSPPSAATTARRRSPCARRSALRMRVSMSAIGSVIMSGSSPARLRSRPGICPLRASSRRQMRHMRNWRKNARGRPQSGQRLYAAHRELRRPRTPSP